MGEILRRSRTLAGTVRTASDSDVTRWVSLMASSTAPSVLSADPRIERADGRWIASFPDCPDLRPARSRWLGVAINRAKRRRRRLAIRLVRAEVERRTATRQERDSNVERIYARLDREASR